MHVGLVVLAMSDTARPTSPMCTARSGSCALRRMRCRDSTKIDSELPTSPTMQSAGTSTDCRRSSHVALFRADIGAGEPEVVFAFIIFR